jgi:hypothetical protein
MNSIVKSSVASSLNVKSFIGTDLINFAIFSQPYEMEMPQSLRKVIQSLDNLTASTRILFGLKVSSTLTQYKEREVVL